MPFHCLTDLTSDLKLFLAFIFASAAIRLLVSLYEWLADTRNVESIADLATPGE